MRGTIGQYAVQRCLEQCVGPNLGHVARVDRQCTGNWYDCAPITVGKGCSRRWSRIHCCDATLEGNDNCRLATGR